MLVIKNLDVSINNKKVLNDFNLTIKEGEIHALMGPNGIGKSTLSRVIMGDKNYKVLNGSVTYNGADLLKMQTDEISRLGIFLAMQEPTQIEGVSTQDFLKTALSAKEGKNIGLYDFYLKCEKASDELKMDKSLIHRSLNVGFSGGEKKKNEVLQIKLLKPSFIILDELDSGLDVDSLKIVSEEISKYQKESGAMILIITHHPKVLDVIKPDYVHIMKNGRIEKTGTSSLAEIIETKGYNDYNTDGEDIHE